jgi:NADH-quinone oxidoreductase subunit N
MTVNYFQEIIRSTHFIVPEIIIGCLGLAVLFAFLFTKKNSGKFLFPVIVFAGILMSMMFVFRQFKSLMHNPDVSYFSGFIHLDGFAVFFKILFLTAGLLFIALSLIESRASRYGSSPEYYIIFTGILLGSMLMVMSANLLMIYIAIELVSISSYMLATFNFDKKSAESGIKYILYGAVSSAVMLYGISMLYGFTQNLDILSGDFAGRLAAIPVLPRLLAVMMMVSGFLFKMAVVPFHIWTPDVYEGAPVPLIAFFSVVPKLAGLVIFTRVFYVLHMMQDGIDWRMIFGLIAIATMFVGNLAALRQYEAKRLMGYSSIAHSGYLMIGVLAFSSWGITAIMIHAIVYMIMNFLVFMMIELYFPVTGGSKIGDYKGQFKYSPVYAVLITIGFVSLIGIPPTGGFTSKFMLFSSSWDSYTGNHEQILLWLVITGVVNTLISLFYYIKIPFFMAFREIAGDAQISRNKKPVFLGLGIVMMVLIFIIFLSPDRFVHLLNSLTFVYRGMTQ